MTVERGIPKLPVRRPLLLLLVASLGLAGCVAPEASHEAHADPESGSSYAPLLDSPIRGLTREQIEAYQNGEGASMALPAELNGYPGPAHVLDLAEPLGLTPEQRAAMERLRGGMGDEAIPRGLELLALHKALDDGFRNGTLDEDDLARLLRDIGEKDAALRLIHLRTHVEAASLLTTHQRALYVELRGYGNADHASHDH